MIHTVADTTIPAPPHHQKGNPSCTVACPPASQDTDGPRLNLQFASMEVQGKKNKINACILSAIPRDRSLINVALYCLDWSKWPTRSEGLGEP
ncbi:Branched-chain-amino-acid aminotransferase [Fusarium oxysporum f. sp. albedinis]|nr:Branched-chain-amino-acid aminotransferase [Fusarium oxysporum f. sp. albedinis]